MGIYTEYMPVKGKVGREHQSAHGGALSRTCSASTLLPSARFSARKPWAPGNWDRWRHGSGTTESPGVTEGSAFLHGLRNPVFTARLWVQKTDQILWGRSSKSRRWAHTFLQSLNHSGGQTTYPLGLSPFLQPRAPQTSSSPSIKQLCIIGVYAAGTQNSGSQPGAPSPHRQRLSLPDPEVQEASLQEKAQSPSPLLLHLVSACWGRWSFQVKRSSALGRVWYIKLLRKGWWCLIHGVSMNYRSLQTGVHGKTWKSWGWRRGGNYRSRQQRS